MSLPKQPLRAATGDKYLWTRHVTDKMRFYNLSPNRVKRVIRAPQRVEEGIVEDTVAAMQVGSSKRRQEIWVMYRPNRGKIRVITAWRYPGKSPERNPVPEEFLEEVGGLR